MSETTGNLEQIRDILFGNQMRAIETQLSRMEERLRQEMDVLRQDIEKSIASQDTRMKDDLGAVAKRLDALDDSASSSLGSLRQQIQETTKGLREEMLAKTLAVSQEVSRESGELREQKADRADLATLFTDLAARLSGNGSGGKKSR
jgi:DNA anti-recombination protein RmuC